MGEPDTGLSGTGHVKEKRMQREELKNVIEQYGQRTPMYLFNTDELRKRAANIREMMPENGEICYAIKANPFVAASLQELVHRYEVCSPGELQICKAKKIPGEKIVFSGVNKRREEVQEAIAYGVHMLTAESQSQLMDINECAGRSGKKVAVLLRLTGGNQFGMDEATIEKIIEKRDIYKAIEIKGIHYFSGTQKKRDKIGKEMEYLLEFANRLEEKYAFTLEIMEYGPGMPVPYFEGEDFEADLETFQAFAEEIQKADKKIRWVIELGRYIAASCGYYCTKVVDVKENDGKNYCIVDGGINHVNYYGQNMAMRVPLIEHISFWHEGGEEKEWTICGSLCTTADVLVRKTIRSGLQIGDYLVFRNIGAYAVTEGIYLFLSRRMPDIYFYSASLGMQLVREGRETYRLNMGMDETERR